MSKVPSDGPAKFPTYDRYPVPEDFGPASGVLARAQGSTAEKGELLMNDHVERITRAVNRVRRVGGSGREFGVMLLLKHFVDTIR